MAVRSRTLIRVVAWFAVALALPNTTNGARHPSQCAFLPACLQLGVRPNPSLVAPVLDLCYDTFILGLDQRYEEKTR